jgi:hypothetical protein
MCEIYPCMKTMSAGPVEIRQHRRGDLLAPLAIRRPAFAFVTGALLVLTFSMFDRLNFEFIYFHL